MPPYLESPLSEFYITVPNLPTHTTVMQHAHSNEETRTAPQWGLLCLAIGAALCVVSGLVLILLGLAGALL